MTEMTYSFDQYCNARGSNWYQSDTTLKAILSRRAPQALKAAQDELAALGRFAAGEMFRLSHEAAQKENEPRLRHTDAYNHPMEDVVLCPQTQKLYQEVYSRKLGFVNGDPFIHYAKLYLVSLNGEAGVCCSIACTDGLERILRKFKSEHPALVKAHHAITHPTAERFFHGAQFVTEIQGGSDVPANQAQAIPSGDHFMITGLKWFCSNINADYFLVTAREEQGLSVFLVPRHLEDGTLNSFILHRLKDKFGTRELATAEVSFINSVGYRVGDPGKGVSLIVGHVLVTSRIHCAMGATALLKRACIEADAFCNFRTAFGKKLKDFSLVSRTLTTLNTAQQNMLAGFFDLIARWTYIQAHPEDKLAAWDTRILISLYKVITTRKASALIHEAMMLLGGNGIEERFSVLPRLYRDAVIYETWEGPHFVLLTQAYNDFKTFSQHHDIAEFFSRILPAPHPDLLSELKSILKDPDDQKALLAFEPFAKRLIDTYQHDGC